MKRGLTANLQPHLLHAARAEPQLGLQPRPHIGRHRPFIARGIQQAFQTTLYFGLVQVFIRIGLRLLFV